MLRIHLPSVHQKELSMRFRLFTALGSLAALAALAGNVKAW